MKNRLIKNLTTVIRTEARYNRDAHMDLYEDKVIFDCSDGEYGPIEFPISILEDALYAHKQKLKDENKTTT